MPLHFASTLPSFGASSAAAILPWAYLRESLGELGKSFRELVAASDAAATRPNSSNLQGSAITSELLSTVDERGFRELILLALFKAMPFKHVEYTHGGILEQGADFVLWERGLTGSTEPIAVVVKAGNIGGATTTDSNTAATTANQIRAALSRSYQDPSQHIERGASRCWVFASGVITKEARKTFENQLEPHHQQRVLYHGADAVLALVSEYLGEASALELLKEAARRYTTVAPANHSVSTIAGSGGVLGVALHAQPGADPIAFTIKLKATGSSASDNAALQSAVNKLMYGGTIENDDGVLVELSPPAMFSSLIPAGEAVETMRLEARVHPKVEVLTVRAVSKGLVLAELPHVLAMRTPTGPKSVKFQVSDIREPIELTINISSEKADFALALRPAEKWNVDAVRYCTALEFIEQMRNADELQLVDERRHLSICTIPNSPTPDLVTHPVPELLRAAALVQNVTNKAIPFPRDGSIPQSQARAIWELATILSGDELTVSVSDVSVTLQVTVRFARALLRHDRDDSAPIVFRQNELYDVSGDQMPFTVPVEISITGAKVGDKSAEALEQWLSGLVTNEVGMATDNEVDANAEVSLDRVVEVELVPLAGQIIVTKRIFHASA